MSAHDLKYIIRRNWFFYSLGLAVMLAGKYFYSQAGSVELDWVLAPTAWWVSLLSGISFAQEPMLGYVSHQARFIIAPSCSGVQFMLLTFATLLFSFIHRMRSAWAAWGWLVCSLGCAYLATVFVNGLRIVLAIYLRLPSLGSGWLTPDRLHTLVGIVVYFAALLIIYRLARYISDRIYPSLEKGLPGIQTLYLGKPFRQTIYKCMPPLFWYFFIVLGIPFLNRAYRQGSGQFMEYAALIAAVCGATILLAAAISMVMARFKGRSQPR